MVSETGNVPFKYRRRREKEDSLFCKNCFFLCNKIAKSKLEGTRVFQKESRHEKLNEL